MTLCLRQRRCVTTAIRRFLCRKQNVCSRTGKPRPRSCSRFPAGPIRSRMMWLAARWRRALKRGPQLIAVTIDHGLRAEAAREARDVKHSGQIPRPAASHPALERRKTQNGSAGGGAGCALSAAGQGRAGGGRDACPDRAYAGRSGRNPADADVARQRHCRACRDGAAIAARRRGAGAPVAAHPEGAAGGDAEEGRRSASPTIRPTAIRILPGRASAR